jgi:hypothetical protein
MTLVIVHPAEGVTADLGLWTAYFEGHPGGTEVTSITDLNDQIAARHLTDTTLIGVPPCAAAGCPYAAVTILLTAAADGWHTARHCTGHRPDPPPADTHLIEDSALPLRGAYSRRNGADVAELTRILIGQDIPPALFAQPACRHCARKLMPAGLYPDADLTWPDADGNIRCGRRPAHTPAEGEPALIIGRYHAFEVRELAS